MKSTEIRSAVALLAGAALLLWPLAAAEPQRYREEGVELYARDRGGARWIVDLSGDGFEAEKPESRRTVFKRVFRNMGEQMDVNGSLMGRDPTGKSKAVIARRANEPPDRAGTKWQRVRRRGGKLLRVPDGPLKGWYVGLGPAKKDKRGRIVAPLILVEDKKDAAPFRWTSPEDEYSP